MKVFLYTFLLMFLANSSILCMNHDKNDEQSSGDENEEIVMKATRDGQYYVTTQATVLNNDSNPQRVSLYLYLNRVPRAKKTVMLEPGKQEIIFIGLYFRLKSTDILETYLNAYQGVTVISNETNLTHVPLGSSIKG